MVTALPNLAQEKKNPAVDLRYVRSVLILRGSTFAEWCRERGFSVAFAHQAARGLKGGPAGRRIVHRLKEEFEK